MRARVEPAEVARWANCGVPAGDLLQWLELVAAGELEENEIPAWEELGISPALYMKMNRPDADRLSPARCREWLEAGVPAKHIRVYDYAKASPADIAPYGAVLAESEPWDIVTAMGLVADSEARMPIEIIAAYVEAGQLPYTAVFLEGHRYPMSESARRRAIESPYAYYERKTAPPISWSAAATVIRTGRPADSLFTLPSVLAAHDVPLMGARRNRQRISRLLASSPSGYDEAGTAWQVGILYPAPYDPVYDFDDLIGVVTKEGHVACLMPGYSYLRSLVEALEGSGNYFIVPIVAQRDPHYESDPDDEPGIAIRFHRYSKLRSLLEDALPPGVNWSWSEWRD
jgi:hypothetical protein